MNVTPDRPLAREPALRGLLVALVLGLTLGLVLGAPGCSGSEAELTPEEREAVAAEVEVAIQAFYDDWSSADFDRGMSWFDAHPDFSFASAAQVWTSARTMDEAFRPSFRDLERQEFRIGSHRMSVLSRDLVHVVSRGTNIQYRRDGTAADPLEFAFSSVWVRTSDGWKVRFAHQAF